jgi:hypothetical protein
MLIGGHLLFSQMQISLVIKGYSGKTSKLGG